MVLEDKALPPFEPILDRFYELAQRKGFAWLEKEGYGEEDFKSNSSVRRKFIQACHYGYDLAQRQIAGVLIEMENDVRHLTEKAKEHRRKKEPQEARIVLNRVQIIRNRQISRSEE